MTRYGLPLAGPRVGDVHGLAYIRMVAVGEPKKGGGSAPPAIVLKALSRLHPELRRRNRTAAEALAERRWRRDVDEWFATRRAALVARNLEFQAVDLGALDDDSLVAHLRALVAHFEAEAVKGFEAHGGDMIPTGLFLSACAGWGITAHEAAGLLQGSSPATVANERLLAPVAAAIRDAATPPASVDDVRRLGPDVAARIDEWLAHHAHRLLSSDDLDATTLAEQPDLQLRALLAASPEVREVPAPDPGPLRARVPAAERARFDERLTEARYGLTLRDDAVGVGWNWPLGLVRHALLEVGRRLVERGQATTPDEAVELDRDEVAPALRGAGPGAAELGRRRAFRDEVETMDPPEHLGPEDAAPPLDAFPKPLATMAAAAMAVIDAFEATPATGLEATVAGPTPGPTLSGLGVGSEPYRGRACVVRSAVDAFAQLEPGDVLVVPFTSPSYDSVFPIAGALVTDIGGPMSHTAIMAREFGRPAVIGTGDATARIEHGDKVEVDPMAGTVTRI